VLRSLKSREKVLGEGKGINITNKVSDSIWTIKNNFNSIGHIEINIALTLTFSRSHTLTLSHSLPFSYRGIKNQIILFPYLFFSSYCYWLTGGNSPASSLLLLGCSLKGRRMRGEGGTSTFLYRNTTIRK